MPAPKPLLREIKGWRCTLAEHIVAGKGLAGDEVHRAVNDIVNAIVYLRLIEAGNVETGPRLAPLTQGSNSYSRLLELVRSVKNQGSYELLEIPAEDLVSDALLKSILRRLYRPGSPFEANLTPAILGQIYESSLDEGPVSNHRSGGANKRRTAGAYYTPPAITEYLVRHTVGPALAGRSPRSARTSKILDPSCGGGAFLLAALDFLFNWSLNWYLTHDPEMWARRKSPPLYKEKGEWRLTSQERARIALVHIHGVDLDAGAVAVARRALTLKVFEGAPGDIFPIDWSANIKRGNALVGPDFSAFAAQQSSDFNNVRLEEVAAFDWRSEFPQVCSEGGFDIVLGNPPYANHSSRDSQGAKYQRSGQMPELETFQLCRDYCAWKYPRCSVGHQDSYKWFVARAIELTKEGGRLAFILPNTWLTQPKYADLKRAINEIAGDLTIIDLGEGVFPVVVPTCLLWARKGKGQVKRFADLKNNREKWSALEAPQFESLRRDGSRVGHPLVQKFISDWPTRYKLKGWVTLREGLHIQRERLRSGFDEGALPIIDSKNMGRYTFNWQPRICYANPQGSRGFRTTQGKRIVLRKTGDSLVATLTPEDESFVLQSLYQSKGIKPWVAPEYLLGLLNSKFLTFLYQHSEFGQKGRVLAQMRKGNLDQLPVPRLRLSNPEHRARHDELVELVKRRLQGEVVVETPIDALVYELYGLTREEIALVERG